MNEVLFYTLAFALLLGALIVVHEMGHYVAARLCGVKVLRFSVGFGRPLLLWRAGRDRTEWAIGAFPLGGYVRMLDETEGEVAPGEAHRSFNRQSVWKRMAIVAAGPLANLALAVAVYWGLFMHGVEEPRPYLGAPAAASAAEAAGIREGERVLKVGGEAVETWGEARWVLLRRMVGEEAVSLELINARNEIEIRRLALAEARNPEPGEDPIERLGLRLYQPPIPAIVGRVAPGSAAEAAGLSPGDALVGIDGRAVGSWADVVRTVRASPGMPLRFEIERGGRRVRADITPAAVEGGGGTIGRIGATVADSALDEGHWLVTVRFGPLRALRKAFAETWEQSAFSLRMIGQMLTGRLSWRHISGPVTIADYAGQTARLGPTHYLRFMALVSLSLAVLNLLPVPVLDGGHLLLYYVAEIVRGRPLSERCQMVAQKIGLALILTLMAFALYNDFTRMIPG
ncbi:MAG: RIP metalloprotease RseP [Candidatus Accumulibacter sp.]|nr:RIP metalloprotease RseP [Accumulibacter sp.]